MTVPFRLLNTLYPGPVTLLFKRLPTVPEVLVFESLIYLQKILKDFNPGVETIGFRIPQNKLGILLENY